VRFSTVFYLVLFSILHMPTPLVIEQADLYGDWIAIARQRLIRSGFDVSHLVRRNDVGQEYCNAMLHLTIPLRPHQVHWADTFNCPAHLIAGLEAFTAKVETGQNLRPLTPMTPSCLAQVRQIPDLPTLAVFFRDVSSVEIERYQPLIQSKIIEAGASQASSADIFNGTFNEC
jgi:hypothetical protein